MWHSACAHATVDAKLHETHIVPSEESRIAHGLFIYHEEPSVVQSRKVEDWNIKGNMAMTAILII